MLSTPIVINTIHVSHPLVRAEDWRSPLIRRLLNTDNYADGCSDVAISFREKGVTGITTLSATLRWSGLDGDFKKAINTYQAPVITEFATLGLACGLLTWLTGLEITEVTRRGEKADYWLGDKELMLEVSGQQSGSLGDLCATKAGQLQDNPFGKEGYVCVACYSNSEARLWFYPTKTIGEGSDE